MIEYIKEDIKETYTYTLPESSIFSNLRVNKPILSNCGTGEFSMTIEYNSLEKTITQNDKNETFDLDILKITFVDDHGDCVVSLSVYPSFDLEGEFKVKNISINGETKPDETIKFKYTAPIEATDMSLDQLITANAIEQYVNARVEAILKEKGVIQ